MSADYCDDIVWKTLVETAKDVVPDISIEFLRKAYEIQKKHQFSQGNNESLQLLEKLIDGKVGGAE